MTHADGEHGRQPGAGQTATAYTCRKIRQKTRIFADFGNIWEYLSVVSHRECMTCMRGMVCVAGGEGCGDTEPSRVQEG